MTMNEIEIDHDPNPHPNGELAIQTVALPSDTNQFGEIYGGWLTSKMDMAASIASARLARGKVATVAIDNITFLWPIRVGALVSCYTRVKGVGRSSVRVDVEAWVQEGHATDWTKVAEGRFVFVAIDGNGRTRAIPRER